MPITGDHTLIDDFQISEQEIVRRRDLLRLTDVDVAALRALHDEMRDAAPAIVVDFYRDLMNEPEIASVIGDAGMLDHLRGTMRRYVVELFSGDYGPAYVRSRLRIGAVHRRLGIAPYLYLSAVGRLQWLLEAAIERIGRGASATARQAAGSGREALRKLMLLDIQLVLDTYIHEHIREVERARQEVQSYAAGLEDKVVERTRQLYEAARRDSLTGLYNQGYFYDLLHREVSSSARYRHPLSLVYIDLNDFKAVNDRHGHRTGDATLAHVGKMILASIRAADLPCRYGGDEFCLVLPHTRLSQAQELCRRLIENFDATETGGVTFSMGVAQIGPEHYADADTLVQWADARMYEAKLASRIRPGHHIRPEWEPDLHSARLDAELAEVAERIERGAAAS